MLASRQGGQVHRRQVREAGLSHDELRGARATGHLLPADAEVFFVGHRAPCLDAELHRALLLGGAGAVLSHASAAFVWGLSGPPRRHEVTVPSNRRARRRVVLHRARLHPRRDVTWRRGLPMTSLLRTIVDCAGRTDDDGLARLVNEAALRGWLHERNVAALHVMVRGRRGARRLRRVLVARDRSHGWTRSQLERAFAELVREADLPRYARGRLVDIGGGDLRECDALWLAQRVMVELDHLAIHESGFVPARDRRRDRRLAASGWVVIRISPDDLLHHRDEVVEDLRKALALHA